jgi:hypothetical protein
MSDGQRQERGLYLPSGYRLDELAVRDLVILRRPDGSEVTVFSATGADPKEVERVAWEDFRGRVKSPRTREEENVSKWVNISVDLGALQAAIGEWPGSMRLPPGSARASSMSTTCSTTAGSRASVRA